MRSGDRSLIEGGFAEQRGYRYFYRIPQESKTMSRKGQKEQAIEDLRAGKTARLRCHGNSMLPRIPSGSKLTIEPVELVDVKVGDAVFCKVKGNMFTHLVTALQGGVDNRRIQISNNHGHVNGWTTTIYGRVTEIEP